MLNPFWIVLKISDHNRIAFSIFLVCFHKSCRKQSKTKQNKLEGSEMTDNPVLKMKVNKESQDRGKSWTF